MPDTLTDVDWELLISRIKKGLCTPFIGAGACAGILPTGTELANKWAAQFKYPMADCMDLIKVAQYVAQKYDPMKPKEEIQAWLTQQKPPVFEDLKKPHRFLAELPLPIYITTNYDNFMYEALKATKRKDPKRDFSRWADILKNEPVVFKPGYEPTVANPVVFHLHGCADKSQSIVITEDDYLDFLIALWRDKWVLPERIKAAFTDTSLLFLGYKLADWDFRVLFRSLVYYMKKSSHRKHVSVQFLASDDDALRQYLDKYLGDLNIRVYWGTCDEFIADFEKYSGGALE
jgi:hypothetical protein